jgi:hypothetical protein
MLRFGGMPWRLADKHGSLLDLDVTPANHDDRASAVPMLSRLAELGFQGDLLGDCGYKGEPFAHAVCRHDMAVTVSPGGTAQGYPARGLPGNL